MSLYETDNNLTADTSLDPAPQEVVTQGEMVNGLTLTTELNAVGGQWALTAQGSVQSTHNAVTELDVHVFITQL